MKKIFCLILAIVLVVSVLTACGEKQEKEFIETITYEKIAQINSVTNLLKKYDRITEKTVNKNLEDDGEFSWNTGMYDITVQGILLKSALPFNAASTVLKPISWMLKKNFKGKYTLSQQPQEK